MTTRPERRRRAAGSRPTLLLTLLLLVGLTSCSLVDGDDDGVPPAPVAGLLDDPSRLDAAVAAFLERRARDLVDGDLEAVVRRTVADRPTERGQRRYARNLSRLPVQVLRYDAGSAEVSVDGDDVLVEVVLRLRLREVDAAAVASPREMVLRADRRDRLRLVSDTPLLADPAAGGAQPWDDRGIDVVEQDGILGVFDTDSVDAADVVVTAAAEAAESVEDVVPYDWSGDAVVYALSDTEVLDSIEQLPGGVADRLDGVAFTLRAAGGGVAGERVVLHPRMLEADELDRDRLLRHELTHVALRQRDERIPTWLSEGVAEWVSVQPVPVAERLISAAALDAARAGVSSLPADDTFNSGPASGANYGISWQVCEEIAAVYGSDALWTLVDAMDARGDLTPDQVLQRVLGTSGDELATGAGERIVAAYG